MIRIYIVENHAEALAHAREFAHIAEVQGNATFLQQNLGSRNIRLQHGEDIIQYFTTDDVLEMKIAGLEYDDWTASWRAMAILGQSQINWLNAHKRSKIKDAHNAYENILKEELRITTNYPGIPDEKFIRVALPSIFKPFGKEYTHGMPSALYEFERVEVKVELVYKLKGVEL